MIKLPFTSICRLTKLFFIATALLFANQSTAQIEINWPDFINDNMGNADDGVMNYDQNVSLSGCTSISFSFDYSSDDWLGSGNLEYTDQCTQSGGCIGDPFNPTAGGCNECWDFLYFDFSFDGSTELTDLFGDTNLSISDSYSWDSDCLDPNETYDIDFSAISQTWAVDETLSLTNFSLICYEGVADADLTIDPGDELCEGDDLDLEVSSAFTDAEWFFGGGNIATGTNVNLTGLDPSDSGTYTVETTDINGCSSSVEFDILVESIPMVCPVLTPIEPCSNSSGLAEIDLTQYESEANCFGSDQILWFEDIGDVPNSPIIDPGAYETFSGSVLAVAFNGTCYSVTEEVFIDVTTGIDPEIDIADPIICEGENLIFDIINTPSCGTCDYAWEGPPGSGVGESTTTSQYSVLNANPSLTGDWTVTVTDDAGCTGSSSVAVTVTSGPTGTISGGGALCPGFCTETANNLTLDLSGGTSPYDVTLSVVVGGIPLNNIVLPAFLPNGSISLCIDPSFGLTPSFEDYDGDGMDDFVIPSLIAGIDFTLELNGIVDANGCSGTGSGLITYSIEPEPAANAPGGPYELCEGNLFDLTSYDDNINASLDILWFEDMSLTMPIANPSAYDPASSPLTVFAVADNGTCFSQPVSLELTEIPTPVLDPVADDSGCGLYTFPIPSGTNLGSNVFYEDASGNPFLAGDITMTSGTYTVFAGDDPNCTDMESFMVTVAQQPTITAPTNELSGCGEIELPIIDVLDLDPNGFSSYFTGANQSGTPYTENDVIMEADGVTQLFVYAENAPNCFDEITIDLNFTSDIEYILPAYPAEACGDFELQTVVGATPGLAYYTEIDGGGIQYLPGDFLIAPGEYTLYLYDTTIDQTCIINSNESFTIDLLVEPILDPIADVLACATTGFILPDITGDFLTGDEEFSTETNGGGDTFDPGETITETTTIFVYNNTSSCPAQEVVFEVTILEPPVAGDDLITSSCQGPQLDINLFLSADADAGGTFESADATLTGANMDLWNSADGAIDTPILFEYIVTSASPLCPPDTAEIIITLTNDLSAGIAIPDSTVCEGETINLFGFLDGESGGGYFVDPADPAVQIFDGEWIAVAGAGDFQYIIEDMGGCSGAQSALSVDVTSMQTFTADISNADLCSGDCLELTLNTSTTYDLDLQISSLLNNENYTFPINASGTQQFFLCAQNPVGEINGDIITLGEQMGSYEIMFENNSILSSCDVDVDLITNLIFTSQESSLDTIFGQVCNGEPFIFNGQQFTTLGGTITDFSLNGCDSNTVIMVEEFATAENFDFVDETYCIGTPVEIGGNIYTDDTMIQLMLPAASVNGCDSTIYVDIKFDNASFNIVNETICLEDTEEYNGVTYGVGLSMGEDTIINGSVLGCDSIILVNLDFFDAPVGDEMQTICQGDTIEILGEEFFEGMESMDIVLSGASANGCDSTVTVMVDFFGQSSAGTEMETICQGDTTNILGVDLFAGMESVDVTLDGASANGCDSIVTVSIDFFPASTMNEIYEKCEGDTIDINGFLITDDNLDGFYTIEASGGDCATVVNYTTELFIASSMTIDTSICQGETIMINGIEFSEDYTFDEMSLTSTNGCDSTVTINVNVEIVDGSINQSSLGNNMYELNFQSTTGLDPMWTSTSGALSCEACATSNIVITEDTEVILSALTANGCLIQESVLLSYIPEEIFIDIFFPNVFTPDEINNTLYVIHGTTGILIDELSIFDRWGNEVFIANDFLTNDEAAAWDGRIDGIDAAEGVYVGVITYTDSLGVEQIEPFSLTLVR